MIAKILLPILSGLLCTGLYFDMVHLRRRHWAWRLLLWLAVAALMLYSVHIARKPGYFPPDFQQLFRYLDVLCAVAAPACIVALCGTMGHFIRHHRQRGERAGCVVAIAAVTAYLYGTYVEPEKLVVRHTEYYSSDLPKAFLVYRILLFSDAHVGTLTGARRKLLQRAIDSINAQQPDLVAFTGDLQNMMPSEIAGAQETLRTIKAADGIFSVLGNHDYTQYLPPLSAQAEEDSLDKTCRLQREMGWTLLRNENRCLRRHGDSIFIAGMENDGQGDRFPAYGNVQHALWHVTTRDFVVMLEHDPTSWRRKILPQSHTQLTLSGHTHGGQLDIAGLTPAQLAYREYGGMYHLNRRALYVTTGLSGVVPLRLGVVPEIVVITLKKQENNH